MENENYIELLGTKYNIEKTTSLELFKLKGSIPNQIFMLKNLRVLKLKGWGLNGNISSQIENLRKLTHLDFSCNKK